MIASVTFRERLPSAAAAIALQAGLLTLLVLSFQVVRYVSQEKESTIFLPPLARPLPRPMMIDARGPGKPKPAAAPPPVSDSAGVPAIANAPRAPATPGNGIEAPPGQAQADCVPPGQARPASRVACPPSSPRAETNEIPLHPESHVKDEEHWAQEWEREHAPYLPGVSAGEHDIHITLFSSDGPSLFGGYRTPEPVPTHAHSSNADFQNALAAYQARMRVLYAKPAPPLAAQSGASP